MRSVLLGTLGLSLLAVVSIVIAYMRRRSWAVDQTVRVSRLVILGLCLHVIHAGEEWRGGFSTAFPRLLGLGPWPETFFVPFNVAWLGIWLLSLRALPAPAAVRDQPPLQTATAPGLAVLSPIWFLGLASIANGIAHPMMAAAVGGYFPGLWSSPLVGIVGFVLVRELIEATRARPTP